MFIVEAYIVLMLPNTNVLSVGKNGHLQFLLLISSFSSRLMSIVKGHLIP